MLSIDEIVGGFNNFSSSNDEDRNNNEFRSDEGRVNSAEASISSTLSEEGDFYSYLDKYVANLRTKLRQLFTTSKLEALQEKAGYIYLIR